MTSEELEYLLTDEVQETIGRYRGDEPAALALKGIPAIICTQIKYLQRCRKKLPAFYDARCIIPPLAFEQSSSSAAASSKQFRGRHCIDMTCGLGMDALHFSTCFEKVTAIEQDEILCRIARHNFSRLGVRNIEVVQGDSAEVVKAMQGEPVDLIYVDPARRKENKKVFLFSDCSPDAVQLMPLLTVRSERVVVKASPLFDVDEAFSLFASYGAIEIEVVSCGNECKELLITVGSGIQESRISNVLISGTDEVKRYVFGRELSNNPVVQPMDAFAFLGVPDVAFYKSRTLGRLAAHYYPGAYISGEQGAVLLPESPVEFPGKIFRIVDRFGYKPKEIVRYLKQKGIKKGTVLKHDFRLPVGQIRKDLKIGEGDGVKLFCTEISGKPVVFVIEDIKI